MAKKTAKRASAGRAKAPAKRSGGAKAPAAPKIPGSPKRVTTGPGASPEELGRRLVSEFNKGNAAVTEQGLWSPKIVSIEGGGMAWHGRKSVDAKNADWSARNTVLGAVAEGPYVGSTGFAVKFRIEVQDNGTGRRIVMDEVGVYTVKNGKIVVEEFMYGPARPGEGMPEAKG